MPVYYEDATGEHRATTGKHLVMLPHEIVGSMYAFEPEPLMPRLIGEPGVSWQLVHMHDPEMTRTKLGNHRCSKKFS